LKTTLLFRFVVLHLILFSLFRFAFYFAFVGNEVFSSEVVTKALILGLRFDLRLALVLLFPLLIFGWGPLSPTASHRHLKRWSWVYTAIGTGWMLFYFFDFGFYGYLSSRINSAILTFLENPDISFGMMWESYPMVWISLGFFAFVMFYSALLQRFVFAKYRGNFFALPSPVLIVSFIVMFSGGLYGHFAQYPLRWSEAFFSPHHFISHLSLNPVLYFFETYEFSKKKEFDIAAVRKFYPIIAPYLGVKELDEQKLNFRREVKGQSISGRPNVVIIIMESMALSKSNLTGNVLNPTPALEELVKDSYWFSQYYSPTEATARNIFSIMTATPDVTKAKSSSRNPMVVDQRLIINAFKDYKKLYFLGGSASWANIRGIFSHNVDDVEIIEEGSFDRGRTDVWGISDLDLLIEADLRFNRIPGDKPFIAVIQMAGFHRPYTIPKDSKTFEKVDVPLEQLKEWGFYSLDQFNSLRFSDYSVGYFMNLAKKNPYYKNTLFVITGDHGLPDDGGKNVGEAARTFKMERYHVPLIFHSPALLPTPGVDTRPAGHADIMTTAAYLAGVDHINTTMGRNLFDKSFDNERYAFTYDFYSEIGEFSLTGDEFYYRYDDLKKGQLYKYKSEQPITDVKEQYPDVFQRMEELAHAYYHSARYLLFNNSKDSK